MMSSSKKRTVLLLFMVLVIAICIRLIGINTRPIWYDEAFSLLISRAGPPAVLEGTLSIETSSASADIHPPAYYFLLWGWIQLFGSSIISGRCLSILISLGTIIFIFFLSRELFDDRAALMAGLGAALFPFQVHYSTEIRMYSLLAFWLTLAVFAFWKGRKSGKWYWWVIFAIAAALGQYTHNLAVFFLIPLASTGLILKDWKTVRRTLLAGLGAVVLYLPWLIHIPAQFSKVQQNYWIERPTVASVFNLILSYITNLPLLNGLLLPGLLISVFCVVLAAFQTFRAFKQKIPGYKVGLWLAFLSFAPPLLLWLFSQWRPVYLERALLPSHAIFCIWFAWALLHTMLPKIVRFVVIGLTLIGAALGIYEHLTYVGAPYAPYQAMTTSLAKRVKPGDLILYSTKISYLPALYFNQTLPQVFIIDEPGSKSDNLAPATRAVLHLNEAPDIRSATQGVSRLWFVIFQEEIDEYKLLGFSVHPQLQYLNDHYQLSTSESWDDLWIFQYSQK
jgi:4-amino-4-deoxy-L-arabinose transferase-like glycosyltransferase